MKKYKLPENCKEINGILYVIQKTLVKNNNNWQVISKQIPLEEDKNE